MSAAAAQCTHGDILAVARAYVARGWAVLPMRARKKSPDHLGTGWQHLRLADADLERAMRDAGAISILCGEPSHGLVDVDLDTPQARIAWPLLGRPTDLRHGRASSPESHAWYRLGAAPPQTERLRDVACLPGETERATLIELRSTGGQTVAPPSTHEGTGETIVWHAEGEPARVEVADLQRAVRMTAAAAMVARRWPEGARHDAALALAGLCLRGGLTSEATARLIEATTRAAGDAEWQDRVRAVADTAAAIAAGKPATGGPRLAELLRDGEAVVARLREWCGLRERSASAEDDAGEPLDLWGSHLAGMPPLDLATVPDVLADLARDVAARHGCDPALIALPALAVCAAALDDRHRVQPRQHDAEWQTAARLWVVPAEAVGGGKSPALAVATRPLRAIDARWGEEDAPAMRRYALALRTYARAVDTWLRAGSIGEPPDEPTRPPARRRVLEDTTTERLADVLADNPGGILIAVDELAGLIGSMDAYRPAGTGKDQPLYLQLADGGPRLIDRVRRGTILVSNWGASLLGGIQPERLRQIAPRIIDDGLLARCVVFFGAAGAADPVDRPADRAALDRYTHTIERLATLPPPPQPYTLSPGAHRHRERLVRIARAVAVLPTTAPGLAAALAKWEGLYARLALTMHAADAASRGQTPAPVIDEATGQCVARLLVDYLLPHAAHLYGELLGQDHLTHARWVAGHILAQQLERISARDIGRAYHGLRDDRRGLDAAMQTLTVAGWLTPADSQPGRPPTRWRVSGRVHALYGARAAAERRRRDVIRERIRVASATLGLTEEGA